MEKEIINDLLLAKQILNISDSELAKKLNVARSTLNRWINEESSINKNAIDSIYNFIYESKININQIKSQLYLEDYSNENNKVLFHGSKSGIDGNIDLSKSKFCNDFGQGFYCGETFEQAAMFISNYPNSLIYITVVDTKDLNVCKFNVDTEWMLAIAYFRGRLDEYADSKIIKKIVKKIENADYIIAPIADNKMFSIIGNFIDGEITDEQCKHCLSATDLGKQYIFKTNKAIDKIKILSKCYMTNLEKRKFLKNREESVVLGNNKVKAARIKYANTGNYIDQILVK